jgi:hypothetical protein
MLPRSGSLLSRRPFRRRDRLGPGVLDACDLGLEMLEETPRLR